MTTSIDSKRRTIGIDIGGTKIAVAAVDGQGTIRASVELATEAELGFDRAVDRMVEAADRVLAEAGWARSDLCGVGVGCAGPLSAERGVINNPYTLPTWIECDIVGRLRDLRSTGLPGKRRRRGRPGRVPCRLSPGLLSGGYANVRHRRGWRRGD